MTLFLAQIISLFSNPFLLSLTLPYILVSNISTDSEFIIRWTLFSMIFLSAVGLFVLFGVRKGFFTDLDISKREQRPLFFLFSAITSVLFVFTIVLFDGPLILLIANVGVLLGLFMSTLLVNLHVKASIHVAGVTAYIVSIGMLYDSRLYIALFFVPLIAWARIKTHNHTVTETVFGGIIGIMLTVVMYIIIKGPFGGVVK